MRPGCKWTRKSNYIYFGKLQRTSWCLRVPNLLKTWKTSILSGRLIRRLPFAQIHISDENRPSASHFQRNKVLNYRTDFQSKKFSILSLCPRRHQSTRQWLLRTRHSTLETWKTSQGQRRGQRCDWSVQVTRSLPKKSIHINGLTLILPSDLLALLIDSCQLMGCYSQVTFASVQSGHFLWKCNAE
jgi:hypothetical protein